MPVGCYVSAVSEPLVPETNSCTGSLIICSVACGEYFPFIIQDLCGSVDEWVPILLSTLLLAVFAEILPQWLIPRHAISWGYYCWPLIWGCMWLTAIISFPLAWILDNLGKDRKDLLDVFTNKQLGLVIKCHEQSEKRGGDLSSDATRFILGTLPNSCSYCPINQCLQIKHLQSVTFRSNYLELKLFPNLFIWERADTLFP